MLTTDNLNGTASTAEGETQEHRARAAWTRELPLTKGIKTAHRLQAAFPEMPARNGYRAHADERPILALFCYEEPGTVVGQFVTHLAAALARRDVSVHVFARKGFATDATGVVVHAMGESAEGDLLDQVQEFTRRACNAFLPMLQAASAPVTVMCHEWSAVAVLSLLRGIKKVDAILSLHSLERQRSDMTSELSQRIEEIELSGLREAKAVLVHEPATAEVVKFWVPECVDRIVCARQLFPVEQFQTSVDPGAIKARYQVGPVDPPILYVGDLDERYGPDLLVKALPGVLKNHPQARLIVVGDGSLYWPLRVCTRYLLLEHAVRLAGSVEGVALQELIQAADVVVVPSQESTPWWPILAAWAAGRPVVATHGAAPGLLEHEQDSVLAYPVENSLVWGIERVLFDAELCRSLAEKGRAKLDERFGWNSVAEQVEEMMGVQQAS